MTGQAASPDPAEIEAAGRRIAGRVHRTPLLSATLLGREAGVALHLKCENLQKTGSFKARGVLNRVLELPDDDRERGVVTVSAGNHAQALAWAAGAASIPATVVMPEAAPRTKVAASEGYGARVVLHGTTHDAFRRALSLSREEGMAFVHPFDDAAIIAGHGSVGTEIVEEMEAGDGRGPDAVIVPVGGGGLIAGVALAVRARSPGTRIFGVEPVGAAAMSRSLEAGEAVELDGTDTIADGLAAPMAGELTHRVIAEEVEAVVTVTDDEIARAVGEILRWTKLLAEPAGAAGVAALLAGRLPLPEGARAVAVVSGGNVDLDALPGLLSRGR